MYLYALYLIKYIHRKIPTVFREYFHTRDLNHWVKNNKFSPPPHIVKQKIIQQYQQQYQCQIFVETGTYLGDMVFAVKDMFKNIFSIEINERLYRHALFTFRTYPQITIMHGDSGILMKRLISQVKSKTLFWLDGHYSGGITGKGNKNCPILEELDAIFSSKLSHVVLIDDAHCFTGKNDYPTLQYLKQFIAKRKPQYTLVVQDNIIRVTPK